MKTKLLFAALAFLAALLSISISHAADITAVGSGNWGDPSVWQEGIVPGTNDSADVEAPFNITVDTNAFADIIYGSGTVTLGPDATLTIFGNYATYQLTTLDATAAGCTVVYAGNPYYAKRCNYYHLTFANTNYVDPFPPYYPFQNFNNFSPDSGGPTPMTIAGNMTMLGHSRVQQASGGAPITVGGNLIIGAGCAWDCSGDNLTVVSNIFIYGLLEDLNGALGSNYFGGNVIVSGPNTFAPAYAGGPYTNGWYVSDVITWGVGGGLTNDGAIIGKGYGSIIFEGAGCIAGTNTLKLPTMTVNGSYTIATTITLITNTPTLNGTLVFDLANTNQLVLLANAGTALYYSGNLNVINSGTSPASGKSYKLFDAPSYGGDFASITLPLLNGGLTWVTNLATSGSFVVEGGAIGTPTLAFSLSGTNLTLTWDTSAFPGFAVQAQTNVAGIQNAPWTDAGSGGVSPFVTGMNPANPAVFFRLYK